MAQREEPREDLLAEATALVERIALEMAAWPTGPVVVGFRKTGCVSIYFDQDPVYQFNTAGELRRAYLGGLRYKADQRRLVSLTPRRDAQATELTAHSLSEDEQARVLHELEANLDRLAAALREGGFKVAGQVANGDGLLERVTQWLAELPRPVTVATAPNAG